MTATARACGLDVHRSDGAEHTVLGRVGDCRELSPQRFAVLPGVREVLRVSTPYRLASRAFHPEPSIVAVGDVWVGGPEVVLIAGPCAVESEEQIEAAAAAVAAAGGTILRGGLFKPRTSPYEFRGLGVPGLEMLRAAAGRQQALRAAVDRCDTALLATLGRRLGAFRAIGALKREVGAEVLDAGREARLAGLWRAWAGEEGVPAELWPPLLATILGHSRATQAGP